VFPSWVELCAASVLLGFFGFFYQKSLLEVDGMGGICDICAKYMGNFPKKIVIISQSDRSLWPYEALSLFSDCRRGAVRHPDFCRAGLGSGPSGP
jgi:hypothetical protein